MAWKRSLLRSKQRGSWPQRNKTNKVSHNKARTRSLLLLCFIYVTAQVLRESNRLQLVMPLYEKDEDHNEDTKSAAMSDDSNRTIAPPLDNNKSARTLVIVQGALRGGDIPWQTLRQNVLDYNPNTDLALLVGDPPPPQYNDSVLFQWAKYQWTFPEYEDWGVPLDQAFGTEWRTTILPLLHNTSNILGGIKEKAKGSGAISFMIRYWLRQRIQENNLTQTYDQFVITRSDHYYLCPHNLSQYDTRKNMFVPKGQDYRGINDRHLIVGKDQVLQALDWFPHVLQHYKEYPLTNKFAYLEHMLETFWNLTGLLATTVRSDRNMFICRTKLDGSRTKKSIASGGLPGVYLKYPPEYIDSMKTCDTLTGIPLEKKKALERTMSQFCGECKWFGKVTCNARIDYIQRKYGTEAIKAFESLMESSPSCRHQNSVNTGESGNTSRPDKQVGDRSSLNSPKW